MNPLVLEFGIVSEKVICGFDDEYGVVNGQLSFGGHPGMMLGSFLLFRSNRKKFNMELVEQTWFL